MSVQRELRVGHRHHRAAIVPTRGPLRELGFPVRVIGHSDTPVVPQRIGHWWLEPVTVQTPIPSRARQRLEQFVATGIPVKAAVVFHEIPDAPVKGSRRARVALRAQRWLNQELPIVADRVRREARARGPRVGQKVLRAARVSLPVAGVILGGAVVIAGGALAIMAQSIAVDPCLVVVTRDGFWIELDRWV